MTDTADASGIRARLLDSWRSLRDADRLGTLLPRSTSREWRSDDRRHGFVTLDYRVYRDIGLPGSGAPEPAPVADLLEVYWSVRTLEGRQDPDWAAAVNAHVILVLDRDAQVEDLERLYRHVVLVRRAIQLGGVGGLVADGVSIALHARGLLLGPALSTPLAIVDALAARADVPLTVGRYQAGPNDAIEFAGPSAAAKPWETQGDPEELARLGARLLSHDQLFISRGAWPVLPPHDPTRIDD